MKNILFLGLVLSLILSCNSNKKNEDATTSVKDEMAFTSIGKEIIADDAVSADRMAVHYADMKVGDTIASKMTGKVDEVCQSKGCWMKLDLENGEQVMVKFKDYGFFMPKDIAGKEVIINGIAYVNEMSVEEQKHYAEDAGESAEAIAAITKPKKTYSFEADGVLLKQ
ncbi:MAG: DUF4920 domain-containing protein [Flavobacteriaceae bacterium]|nr:DUF4920 domain-containing protein [Bacteroidia bacterium]MBT8286443.1 DUF4920 domain-containing protein [Bacteroidia bacterium]NNF75719.1 DUF4920 domain-containing protein [Flavobacteriaceae bacterium]NNK74266.1 DUF4920 domain-containing protein [Flavobacteriaceae bacterium]